MAAQNSRCPGLWALNKHSATLSVLKSPVITEQLKSQIESQELRCPFCHGKLEVFWQKRQSVWCVLHARTSSCEHQFTEFSRSDLKDEGGSPEQAEERTREQIRAYLERLNQNTITNKV